MTKFFSETDFSEDSTPKSHWPSHKKPDAVQQSTSFSEIVKTAGQLISGSPNQISEIEIFSKHSLINIHGSDYNWSLAPTDN